MHCDRSRQRFGQRFISRQWSPVRNSVLLNQLHVAAQNNIQHLTSYTVMASVSQPRVRMHKLSSQAYYSSNLVTFYTACDYISGTSISGKWLVTNKRTGKWLVTNKTTGKWLVTNKTTSKWLWQTCAVPIPKDSICTRRSLNMKNIQRAISNNDSRPITSLILRGSCWFCFIIQGRIRFD